MSRDIKNEHIRKLNEEFAECLSRNSYSVIADLRELFTPKKDKFGRWRRISCTGELQLCDYGAGLVDVRASYMAERSRDDTTKSEFIGWVVRFSVGTLDDGTWGAWSKLFDHKDDAIDLMNKLGEELLPELAVLPTDEKLNEMLRPYGMYGEYEG